MTSRSRLLIPALRELGIEALLQYGAYRLAFRSGMLRRRTKPYLWSDRPLESWLRKDYPVDQAFSRREPFFFMTGDELQKALEPFSADHLRTEADEILAGKYRLFGGPPVSLGTPPEWGAVPLTDELDSVYLDKHWTEYDPDDGRDWRLLWEPSRFGWVYTLSRAYHFTGQLNYAEAAVDLLFSWLDNNQPNHGPNWISGQEAALRIQALAFMWYALGEYFDRSRSQAARLLAAIAVHADRIPPTFSYARAQRNNHLLTEAVGLYTVGLLMPWFEKADEWKRRGRRSIIRALDDQVFTDGGYIQYSTNYQRLALSAGLWAGRLAEIHGEPLPSEAINSLRRMTEFLLALIEPQTGAVPNLGHNDGSNILPLSASEHGDYRPLLQAASRSLTGTAPFGPGHWDEMSVWLGLPVEGAVGQPHPEQSEFTHTGVYLIRGETSRATLRCARFAARPAHSDQLQLDLWWGGDNIIHDVGSYRYSTSDYAGALAHNSPVIDRQDSMDRAGRFLWLNWSHARFLGRWQADDGSVQAMASEHPLRSGITHRRSIVHAGRSLWVVLDELLPPGGGSDIHQARLAWSLIDWPWEFDAQRLTLQGHQGPVQLRLTPGMDTMALYRAGERVAGDEQPAEDAGLLGWWSPTYGHREPALTLVASMVGGLPLRMTSWVRLGDVEPGDLALSLDSLEEDPLLAFLSTEQP